MEILNVESVYYEQQKAFVVGRTVLFAAKIVK